MSEITEKIKVEEGRKDCVVLDMSCVKTIADMQRDLDAYHFAFVNIIGMLRGKFGKSFVPAISQNMAASESVNDEIHDIFMSAKELREEYEKLIESKDNPALSIRIEDCNLSVKVRSICKHNGFETLGDLTKITKTDFFKFNNVGILTLCEIEDLLKEHGLTLAK